MIQEAGFIWTREFNFDEAFPYWKGEAHKLGCSTDEIEKRLEDTFAQELSDDEEMTQEAKIIKKAHLLTMQKIYCGQLIKLVTKTAIENKHEDALKIKHLKINNDQLKTYKLDFLQRINKIAVTDYFKLVDTHHEILSDIQKFMNTH